LPNGVGAIVQKLAKWCKITNLRKKINSLITDEVYEPLIIEFNIYYS